MRVIVANGTHQIPIRLVEVSSHDDAGGSDIEARAVDQPLSYLSLAEPRVASQGRQPERVNLHHSQILTAISVEADAANTSPFSGVDGG